MADRFAFVVEVPSWEQLSDEEQGLVISSQGTDADIVPDPELAGAIEYGRRLRGLLDTDHAEGLVIYVRLLIALLGQAGLQLSPRRAGMILRNILAVHAANRVLGFSVTFQNSALLAVRSSVPQLAQGIKVDQRLAALVGAGTAAVVGPKTQNLQRMADEQRNGANTQ